MKDWKYIFKKILARKNGASERPKENIRQNTFHPDRPIESAEEGRLGFSSIADNLAISISNLNAKDGLVIGIEGAWGCGKSSILNLFCAKIKGQKNISIIRFSPWIIGNRDSMVSSLMGEVSNRIEEIVGKKDLAKKLRQYGAHVGKLASLANLADSLGVPHAKKVGALLNKGGEMLSLSKPLSALKDDLTKSLRELDKSFVVIIDDLDRLEPEEALEIMRLIRAVGDFPNIIYILCYDRKILSESLKMALRIEDGGLYLQKIVQASFSVPKPEEFDLRGWLNEECHLLHQAITGTPLSKHVSERLKSVCYTQGGQIETPREVNLALNSLRLVYPSVAGKVDFPDLCWLHLIKIKNDAFYRWIENYLNIFSVVSRGEGRVDEAEHTKIAAELLQHLGLTENTAQESRAIEILVNLQEHLPGIASFLSRGENPRRLIFNSLSEEDHANLESGFRLGSPSHYRLYFSFSQPSGTLDEAELAAIISKANSGVSVESDFKKFIGVNRPQGGTMYSVFLDRLKRTALERYTPEGVKMLLNALIETIDEASKKESNADRHFKIDIGRTGVLLFSHILPSIAQAERREFIKGLFREGKSIGWLVADFMGGELFAQGRNGLHVQGQSILTPQELDDGIHIVNERLVGSDRTTIPSVPDPLSFFYRWQQSGDLGKENLRVWISEFSDPDKGFLDLLEMCRGYVVSSNRGAYRPLNQREIDNLFESPQDVMQRVEGIAESANHTELKAQAQELLEAYKWQSL